MPSRPIAGDEWNPSAGEHRRILRSTGDFERNLLAAGAPPRLLRLSQTLRHVRNATGGYLDRAAVLGLSSAWIDPATAEDAFFHEIPLEGATPAWPAHDSRFGVLIEPAADNQIMRVVVAGVAVCRVVVASGLEWYESADITHGDTATLTLLPAGGAQVLWRETGSGTKWAIVRLGTPTPPPSFYGKTDAQIAAGGSGVVSIWRDGSGGWSSDSGYNLTAYAPPLLTEGHIDAGAWVRVTWHPPYRRWVITGAECELDYYGCYY